MSLSGTLDTVTVGEVLSLLGVSGTTGALRVWSDSEEGTVFCRDGEVTFVAVGDDGSLGDVLVRGGFVPSARWDELERLPDLGRQLGDILASDGVDTERVHRFLAKQTEESVFELDRWTAGELRFEPDMDHSFTDFFRYPTPALLASVGERREAWSALLGRIGSVERIVHQAPVTSDGDDEVSVSRSQLALVSQVDGRRSVRELARFLGTGLFQTCEVVADLVDVGLLQLAQDRVDGSPRRSVPAPSLTAGSPASSSATGPAPVPASTPETVAVASASPGVDGPTEFVEAGDGPARDLILRLLSAVKEEL